MSNVDQVNTLQFDGAATWAASAGFEVGSIICVRRTTTGPKVFWVCSAAVRPASACPRFRDDDLAAAEAVGV